MGTLLVSWLGRTDLRAVAQRDLVGCGPIAQALQTGRFDSLELICDYDPGEVAPYPAWLQGLIPTPVTLHPVTLPVPTDFGAIYQEARRVLADPGIVCNRLKVASAIGNAQAVVALHRQGTDLASLAWDCVDAKPRQNAWSGLHEVPTRTPESDRLSKALKDRGFRFVGTTICYAFMQAVGMVNDHTTDCFRNRELGCGKCQGSCPLRSFAARSRETSG